MFPFSVKRDRRANEIEVEKGKEYQRNTSWLQGNSNSQHFNSFYKKKRDRDGNTEVGRKTSDAAQLAQCVGIINNIMIAIDTDRNHHSLAFSVLN